MGSDGSAGVVWAVVALSLLWLALAVFIAVRAARRMNLAEQVLETARATSALLERTPARPLLVRPDDRVEADERLVRDLGLGSPPARFNDLCGNDSGLLSADLAILREEIETARVSAGSVSCKVGANGSPRVF